MKYLKFFFILTLFFCSHSIAFASFSDVPDSHPNYTAIEYAESEGIVNGYPDGTFKPYMEINRAEFTKIVLKNEFGVSASGLDHFGQQSCDDHFTDISPQDWFFGFVCNAFGKKIIEGYGDGTFRPSQNISYVEAAKIIVLTSGEKLSPGDPWYKPYVDYLNGRSATPETIVAMDQNITRGEMVEIIYRLSDHSEENEEIEEEIEEEVSSVSATMIGACSVFPSDNPWNTDISEYPVHENSDNYISSIGLDDHLHPDFGGNGKYGIPFITVDNTEKMREINYTAYGNESDPGPFPIPFDAPIEGGSDSDGDRHVIAIDTSSCMLYELYRAFPKENSWDAASGAKYDLNSNDLRPNFWTSADAAGLPIFPGLVRYDEVANGEVTHALRFTVSSTQKGFIHPATHYASSNSDENLPPMGLRLRLKSEYDISGHTGQSRVILEGLKKYGMIVADNGSDWFITGAADARWDDDDLGQLKTVPGSAFEVVHTGEIIN